MGILYLLLVGLVAGWLAGTLMRGGGFGMAGDMAVGVLGALIGGFIFGGSGGGLLGRILVATLGAVILIVVLRLIKRA
ncbi:MAG: GlsB/YeaQ/YmgE family stress response membrane protein [Brachymonas sp.]|jgi:uncharacterized membrane protein YeaQ/YmgE (transglycosylase-associated protein family)|uniref:GlsB/YeaQ/YmgE family stress response membrane protein n=1 Tax=unclassified Brachymonas TaxID=2621329 RepID=UPI0035AE8005